MVRILLSTRSILVSPQKIFWCKILFEIAWSVRQGTIQKFVDDFLHNILTVNDALPCAVKWLFDLLDTTASTYGIVDAEVCHAWKSNRLAPSVTTSCRIIKKLIPWSIAAHENKELYATPFFSLRSGKLPRWVKAQHVKTTVILWFIRHVLN